MQNRYHLQWGDGKFVLWWTGSCVSSKQSFYKENKRHGAVNSCSGWHGWDKVVKASSCNNMLCWNNRNDTSKALNSRQNTGIPASLLRTVNWMSLPEDRLPIRVTHVKCVYNSCSDDPTMGMATIGINGCAHKDIWALMHLVVLFFNF